MRNIQGIARQGPSHINTTMTKHFVKATGMSGVKQNLLAVPKVTKYHLSSICTWSSYCMTDSLAVLCMLAHSWSSRYRKPSCANLCHLCLPSSYTVIVQCRSRVQSFVNRKHEIGLYKRICGPIAICLNPFGQC